MKKTQFKYKVCISQDTAIFLYNILNILLKQLHIKKKKKWTVTQPHKIKLQQFVLFIKIYTFSLVIWYCRVVC